MFSQRVSDHSCDHSYLARSVTYSNNLFYFSLGDTSTSVPASDSQNNLETGQKGQRTVSLKVEATLSELDVLVRQPHKKLADIKVRGM